MCGSFARWLPIALCVSFLAAPLAADEPVVSRIAFGSCVHQDKPQPIWDAIAAYQPQAWIMLGDNIYGDSDDMQILRAKWAQLAGQPGFQKVKAMCPVLATWDDHDYGRNDAGADFEHRTASQQVFLDFLDEPADSARRKQEGVYQAISYGPSEKRIQILLLDTRYHRSPLVKHENKAEPGEGVRGNYGRNDDPEATVLGETQWKWLEEQLKQPAKVRLIGSSIQLVPEEHGFEKWGNFPRERQRFIDLVAKTQAAGVIVLSGDRHRAEISQGVFDAMKYPLLDITSSSLNSPTVNFGNELNRHRLGRMYDAANFGTIDVDWQAADPVVRLQVRGIKGDVVLQVRTALSRLRAQ